jgi:hypothetical protein
MKRPLHSVIDQAVSDSDEIEETRPHKPVEPDQPYRSLRGYRPRLSDDGDPDGDNPLETYIDNPDDDGPDQY